MTISPSATYTTRSGLPVRIYAVDGGGEMCVHGAYQGGDGSWVACTWTAQGRISRLSENCDGDLLPAPREWKRWVVIDDGGPFQMCFDEIGARRVAAADTGRKIVEITIRAPREGEA